MYIDMRAMSSELRGTDEACLRTNGLGDGMALSGILVRETSLVICCERTLLCRFSLSFGVSSTVALVISPVSTLFSAISTAFSPSPR